MSRASTLDVLQARRIVFQGVTGAGKSTAVRRWAQLMGLKAIDYDDDVLWMPAEQSPWTIYSAEQQRERVVVLIESGAWAMASCGSKVADIVFPQTDVIVYLDYSPWVTFRQLFYRTITRAFQGGTCCNGNRESFKQSLMSKDSIFLWWMQSWRERRTDARDAEKDPKMPPVYRLTHPRQLEMLIRYAPIIDAGMSGR